MSTLVQSRSAILASQQAVREETLAAVLESLDALTLYVTETLEQHRLLALDAPQIAPALPDAMTKVEGALVNLQSILPMVRDTATRGYPLGYGLPAPPPPEPPTEPEPPIEPPPLARDDERL